MSAADESISEITKGMEALGASKTQDETVAETVEEEEESRKWNAPEVQRQFTSDLFRSPIVIQTSLYPRMEVAKIDAYVQKKNGDADFARVVDSDHGRYNVKYTFDIFEDASVHFHEWCRLRDDSVVEIEIRGEAVHCQLSRLYGLIVRIVMESGCMGQTLPYDAGLDLSKKT